MVYTINRKPQSGFGKEVDIVQKICVKQAQGLVKVVLLVFMVRCIWLSAKGWNELLL
jgi:hypothetical protein